MAPTASASRTVTWRQVVAAVAATACLVTALLIVFRSDGLPAVDAASSRATRWFVHQPSGQVVLVDGFGGRALTGLQTDTDGDELFVAEGVGQAYLVDDARGEIRTIDTAELRLGPPQVVGSLGGGSAIARVGTSGLVVADPVAGEASLVASGAEPAPITFEPVVAGDVDEHMVVLSPDGAVWQLVDGALRRTGVDEEAAVVDRLGLEPGPDGSALSMVGLRPFVLDRVGSRVRLGTGDWVDLDLATGNDGTEIVLQQPGPQDDCGWVGADDQLWCVDEDGIVEEVTIAGLDIDGPSILAVAGDAAAVVHRGPTEVVRFDWRTAELLGDEAVPDVDVSAALEVTATVDVIWIDEVEGDSVWTVHPWGIQQVDKADPDLLVLGADGQPVDAVGDDGGEITGGEGIGEDPEEREDDNDGFDDPPQAVPDQATARAGNSVQAAVTANDFDPDGDAIAVIDVGTAGHGDVEIASASSVVYVPRAGYVGIDRFDYTITDPGGNTATAEVTIELLPADASNRAPVGRDDVAQTGTGAEVVVEVLLNDIDPERDALRIESVEARETDGVASIVDGPSGAPAILFRPERGFEGTANLVYRPVDVLGAVGEDVSVAIEVAPADGINRAPTARPDAIRVRRNDTGTLPVLLNDVDPDNDTLVIDPVDPVPDGLAVVVDGDNLRITPRAGGGDRIGFVYEIDDGRGGTDRASVLVIVIGDTEPNRPPTVAPDLETVVVGQTVTIDVTANDSDPDGDELAVIGVTQPEGRGSVEISGSNQVSFTPTAIGDEEDATARFTYTVTDGFDHEVNGDVIVTVLPEPLPDPPYAQDDSARTTVGTPVTIDVLRNDGDPSGERPRLFGTPSCLGGGTAVVTVDEQVRYEPPVAREGSFRCTYEVTNSRGLLADAAINISVRRDDEINQPPIASNDSETVEMGETKNIAVLANDLDPGGDRATLELTAITQPTWGSATRVGRQIRYVAPPSVSETRITTITYTVADELGATDTGSLQIRITPQVNQGPRANPDDAHVLQRPDTSLLIDVRRNDFDEDDETSSLVVSNPTVSSGSVSVVGGGVISVTPDPEYLGAVTGAYTLTDPDGASAVGTFSLTVVAQPNRPPVAEDDAGSVANGGSTVVDILGNDGDPDGDAVDVRIVSGPSPTLGTASLTSSRQLSFSAVPGQSGTAEVVYEISDEEFSDTATVRIAVQTCAQSTPVASDAFLETGYQQPISVDLNNYSQNGVITDVLAPSSYVNGVYTPPPGTNGTVTIDFAVVNDCRERDAGRITIDVNQDPVGQNQSVTLVRGETREIVVGEMATDDEPLQITGTQNLPPWVTVGPGKAVISPTEGVADGVYSFVLTVSDPGGLATLVTVEVTISNRPPIARPDTVDLTAGEPVTFDLVANDEDPDGPNGDLRLQAVPSTVTFANGVDGTVTQQSGGKSVRIDPGGGTGQATFQYSVVDPSGAVSPPAMVTVLGPAANNPPVAENQSVSVQVGPAAEVTLAASDPDGDPLTVTELVDASGIVVGAPNGLVLTVDPSGVGEYLVTYRVTDGKGGTSAIATLTVTATPQPSTTTSTTTTTTTVPPDTTTTTTTTTVPSGATTTTTTTTTEPPGPTGPPITPPGQEDDG